MFRNEWISSCFLSPFHPFDYIVWTIVFSSNLFDFTSGRQQYIHTMKKWLRLFCWCLVVLIFFSSYFIHDMIEIWKLFDSVFCHFVVFFLVPNIHSNKNWTKSQSNWLNNFFELHFFFISPSLFILFEYSIDSRISKLFSCCFMYVLGTKFKTCRHLWIKILLLTFNHHQDNNSNDYQDDYWFINNNW